MDILRPNAQRAKTAIVFIYVILGVEIIALISDYFQYDLLESALNGRYISTDTAEANDSRQTFIGFSQFIFLLISGITFIRWFRRAYFNLHLKVDNLLFAEGWAAGSWFVPIICLFRPFQIMKELYNRTDYFLLEKVENYIPNTSNGSLGLWWALWIIVNFVGNISFRTSLGSETVQELLTVTSISMIMSVINIPLCLITIRIIKNYSIKEEIMLMHENADNEVVIDLAEKDNSSVS